MPSATQAVRIYCELADWHQQQGQPQQRDRFLVLAADAALAAGQRDEAERLRHQLLQLNPHHLLKPYGSFAEATRAGDVQSYLTALRQSHPWEAAERLLATLRSEEPGGHDEPPDDEPGPPVFRVRHEETEPRLVPPRPRQAPPPHPRPSEPPIPLAQPLGAVPTKPRGTSPPRPTPRLQPFPLDPEPGPLPTRRPRQADTEDLSHGGGEMIPLLLFALVLAAGVGLAVYTFVRPFFSP